MKIWNSDDAWGRREKVSCSCNILLRKWRKGKKPEHTWQGQGLAAVMVDSITFCML